MSKSSRYEWRDQQAALQERMKGFLANPGNEQLKRWSPKCAPMPRPPSPARSRFRKAGPVTVKRLHPEKYAVQFAERHFFLRCP